MFIMFELICAAFFVGLGLVKLAVAVIETIWRK